MAKKPKDQRIEDLKMPPHSIEAEQSVLGGLMLDNHAWDKIADRISESDFYQRNHRIIFNTIAQMASTAKPLDVLTVAEQLKSLEKLDESGGEIYLFELAKNTPGTANVAAYADIVRERSILRQLIGIANDIADNAFNTKGRESKEILDEAEQQVFSIAEQQSKGRKGARTISDLLGIAVERIDTLFHSDQLITGVPSGYEEFDDLTSGLQKSDLIIVAGRPSMGKTSFAMNVAEHVAIKAEKPVLIFSMEMSGESLAMRMLSSLGRIDQHKIRTGKLEDDDWPRITSAVSILSRCKLLIDDTPSLSPAEIRARARRAYREQGGLGLIVIDYMQLMQVPGSKENRTTEISEISRNLKALARELDVPVVALSQLNRGLEQRNDKRPVMSDLRECVVGGTLVVLGDGRRVPIKSLVDQTPEVVALDHGKLIKAKSEKIWKVGKKPIFKVSLTSGRMIYATEEHRLFGFEHWKTIKECQVGDRIAIARQLPEFGKPFNWSDVNNDLFWDSIKNIESVGEDDVYDLTVPGYESWLADGIISHNSGAIEQDADLIVFIYRDEVYNDSSLDKGKAEIIIGKQRNGPTGKVLLTFLGKYTRFENLAKDSYNDSTFAK